MIKKKLFLSGVGGMLGKAFYEIFSEDYILKCTDIDLNEKWLEYLDFREADKYKMMVEKFRPDYLFHIGAFTDLEYCEKNEIETYRTNTESVKTAVSISNELKIPLLYISTAGIFDGLKKTYDENDIPKPMGIYAISKYRAEEFVVKNSNNFLICRAGWMMGGGPQKDKKFINKIMKQIKEGKKELFIVDDKFGTPTYTHDFAKNTKALIESNNFGLYNMACEGNTSRLDVVVDLRMNSPTYGKNFSIEISQTSDFSFFIPENFAHGFLCLSKNCAVYYKCTSYRNKSSETTIKWNDETLNIKWPIKKPILSKKDKMGIKFSNFK